jgi:hypothetical protein
MIDSWNTGIPVRQVYHRQFFSVTHNLFSCNEKNKRRK